VCVRVCVCVCVRVRVRVRVRVYGGYPKDAVIATFTLIRSLSTRVPVSFLMYTYLESST